jgi:hypothetical protein
MSWRGLWLYARTRQSRVTLAAIVACTGFGRLLGGTSLRLNEASAAVVPWVALLPAAAAVIAATSMATPTPVMERLAARRLRSVRSVHVLVLLACVVGAAVVTALGLPRPYGVAAAVRNGIGFIGVGLLSGQVTGYRLSWILPLTWALASVSFGATGGHLHAWAVPISPDTSATATVIAVSAGLVGILVAVLHDPASARTGRLVIDH